MPEIQALGRRGRKLRVGGQTGLHRKTPSAKQTNKEKISLEIVTTDPLIKSCMIFALSC
jgi:hypothetical protein